MVSGPSGAGKSTILSRVLEEMGNLRFSVSHTTRAPREGETEGVQYHFVDRPTFEDMRDRGLFLEWAEVHGELYGTSRAEYDRAATDGVDLLLDLDVQGAAQVRKAFPDAVTVFILPPSYTELERRLRGRGAENEGNFRRRLQAAGEELSLYRAVRLRDRQRRPRPQRREPQGHHPGRALPHQPRRAPGAENPGDVSPEQGEMTSMTHLILPKDVDSKFRFITVAAQRAKQLQNGAKPRVEARSRKPTRIAMQEVLAEAVSWEIRDEMPPAAAVPVEA